MARLKVDRAALEREVQKSGRRARDEVGRQILEESQRLVPVRSGDLKRSGFVETDDEVTRVGYGVFYAHMVENGTNDTPREPFLRPAALKKRTI